VGTGLNGNQADDGVGSLLKAGIALQAEGPAQFLILALLLQLTGVLAWGNKQVEERFRGVGVTSVARQEDDTP